MTFLAAKDIKNRCTPVMVASVLVSVSAKLSADTGLRTTTFSGYFPDTFPFFFTSPSFILSLRVK